MGIGLAVAAATYCVLAYIFMWPPVVKYYWNWHRNPAAANYCVNNLRSIDAALNQFALEHHKNIGDSVTLQDLSPYIKLNSRGEIPTCLVGGPYNVAAVGSHPTCSYATNISRKMRVDLFYYDYTSPSPHDPHKLP